MNRRTYLLFQVFIWIILYPLFVAWVLRRPFHTFEIIVGIGAVCGWGFNLYRFVAPFLYGEEIETRKLSLSMPAKDSLSFPLHGLSGAKFIIFSRTNFIRLRGAIRLVNEDGGVAHQLLLNDASSDTGLPALKTTRISSAGKGSRLDQLRTLTLPHIGLDASAAKLTFDLEWFSLERSLEQNTLDLEITFRGRKVLQSTRTTVEFS